MTDQTPAEAAAAAAPAAHTAADAASPNADLVGGSAPGTTDPTVAALEAQLAALKAHPSQMSIPHAQPPQHIVPAAQEHHATDSPVVHHVIGPQPTAAPVVKAVTPSAALAAKLAAIPPGAKPVKRQYAYQRNRR